MFWKKKEGAAPKGKAEGPADGAPAAAAPKPCCSGKKTEAAGNGVATTASTKTPLTISTFEFGGTASSGVKLYGECVGPDPDAINACLWSPDPAAAQHKIVF